VLGDVGDPQPIGAIGPELAVDQVRPRRRSRSGPAPPAAVNALQADEFHAPPHPLVADRHPVAVAQLGVHPAHPVGLPRSGVDRGDSVGQLRVLAVPVTGRPAAPFVETRGRDLQDPAGHRDRETLRGQLLDQPEPYFGRMFSRAK